VCTTLELEEKVMKFSDIGMTDPMQLCESHEEARDNINSLSFENT
jgi:hypothetical protein